MSPPNHKRPVFAAGASRGAASVTLVVLAVACAHPFGGDCTNGTSACMDGQIAYCQSERMFGPAYWKVFSCAAPLHCLAINDEKARCVESDTLDPRCPATWYGYSSYCDGDNVVTCMEQYPAGTAPCSVPGFTCIMSSHNDLKCVSKQAYEDPVCKNGDGARCNGTWAVKCFGGRVIGEVSCRTCTEDESSAAAICAGACSANCSVDADCRDGLVCVPDPSCRSGPACDAFVHQCAPKPDAPANGDAGADAAADSSPFAWPPPLCPRNERAGGPGVPDGFYSGRLPSL
jgi:hypothetical protein